MITEKILEALQRQAEFAVDLFDIIFSTTPDAYRKAKQILRYGPTTFKADWAHTYKKRQQFYALLNKLKREGFIEREGPRRAMLEYIHIFTISKTGTIKEITIK